jgi:membrane protein DedA with SNARE-associated domain
MQQFISSYGYLAILLLMVTESACIPIPSELTMPFGGAIAAGAVAGFTSTWRWSSWSAGRAT